MCGIRVDHMRSITRALTGSAADKENRDEDYRGCEPGGQAVHDRGRILSGNENRAGPDGYTRGGEPGGNLLFSKREDPGPGW